ncbi:taste receptor type 2 member 116 [Rattus norvegicus]|uniref:Taste receptor type 2 member 116 n=2 Tax=Rattus norvegicus TaxID=10116 RepID=TR116_RAT|nr:taste receptor type 2 member 116 [Rattus norvegicus]Q67ER8.1 RecName: Full=Taste receptor type 2 member 116; Short=T2R116; AltName: Full=Taste receptor type 2 member 33; Short=T2R33 [Rattus norvegicus]AAR13361.1 putative taste receptor T2R33 [Rattus norvegicus]|eukprot:NP_001160151.1 taste receptor type 2 member 116 [Rattus norvegicus]
MNGVLYITFTVILSVEVIIGNFGNGIIALVNIMDLAKRRKISSVDQILTALAISRIVLLWLVLVSWWLSMFYPGQWMTEGIDVIVHNVWTTLNQISLWLATSFSVFCFLKVANFSNTIFFYLKIRVKKVMTGTLIMFLLLLGLNIIVINASKTILIPEYKVNMSNSLNLKNTQISMLFPFANTLFGFIPFAVSLVTFLLLFFSLWKHQRKMHHGAQGCRDSSTKAHIRVLQTLIASILLYFVFFLSLVVKVWISLFLERMLLLLITQAAKIAFPSLHPWVLILGNAKLRKASLSALQWLRCRHKDEHRRVQRPEVHSCGSSCMP